MKLWHTLTPCDCDNAFRAYQRTYNMNEQQVLLIWQNELQKTMDVSRYISSLQQHFQHASKNKSQPSMLTLHQLSSEQQQIVHILHIMHAKDRQHAILSPRFDYLTIQYLNDYNNSYS